MPSQRSHGGPSGLPLSEDDAAGFEVGRETAAVGRAGADGRKLEEEPRGDESAFSSSDCELSPTDLRGGSEEKPAGDCAAAKEP